MATFPQLSRVLAARNLSPVRMDGVGRQLRDAKLLPVHGRGASAAHLDARGMARIAIAYCGCGKAVRAADRLIKLETLKADSDGRTLLDAVVTLLTDSSSLGHFRELRISRVRRRAQLVYSDFAITFTRSGRPLKQGRLEVEASLDAALVALMRDILADAATPLIESDEDEDAD